MDRGRENSKSRGSVCGAVGALVGGKREVVDGRHEQATRRDA